MKVNADAFISWAKEYFDEVTIKGDEVKVNSCFTEDTKQHLWCNPHKNAYHCWKSEKSGNLIELVSHVSHCSFAEATTILEHDNVRELEEKLEKFFKQKEAPPKPSLSLPTNTYPFSKLTYPLKRLAEVYLAMRKIPADKLLLCINGKYRDRIIIPYYNKEYELIYWNARDITGKSKTKYLGPENIGIGKGDVLYVDSWNVSKVYLAEGEFDAMSLTRSGLNGAACGGKELSEKQVELLRPYQVCVCFDNDKSGAKALNIIGDKLISHGFKDITYVRPPVGIKDWNKMLVDLGEQVVHTYVTSQERQFTSWTSTSLRLNNR